MKQTQLKFQKEFGLALGNERSQAAEMTLQPGGTEGGPQNSHRGSDQWLFVVSGTGEAIVNRHTYPLKAGTLMLIEHGDTHEIRATGKTPLKTINIYVPPAYLDDETSLPAGKSNES